MRGLEAHVAVLLRSGLKDSGALPRTAWVTGLSREQAEVARAKA